MTNDKTTNNVQTELRKIADGVRSDIFKSYEALNLLHMIGANATDINNSGFGILFGRLQLILQEQIILIAAKIFEKPDGYPLKSIPGIVKLIEEHKQEFAKLESKDDTVIKLLKQLGLKSFKKDDSVTEVFFKYWQNYFGEMKLIRKKIETLRSKVAAHHENIDDESVLPDISLKEIIYLLERSKKFLAIIDSAYLNLVSVDYEGNYFANSESKTASLILKNLLVKAHVIDIQKNREISKNLHE
jgi:hypothetical protein